MEFSLTTNNHRTDNQQLQGRLRSLEALEQSYKEVNNDRNDDSIYVTTNITERCSTLIKCYETLYGQKS